MSKHHFEKDTSAKPDYQNDESGAPKVNRLVEYFEGLGRNSQEQQLEPSKVSCKLDTQLDSAQLQPAIQEEHGFQETNTGAESSSAQLVCSSANPSVEEMSKTLNMYMHSRRLQDDQTILESTKEDLEICQQEMEKCKQKYDKLVETERKMMEFYQERLDFLEAQLRACSGEDDGKQKVDEASFSEKQVQNASRLYMLELNSIETRYKTKQAEVEQLREVLQNKEKELGEIGEEAMVKKAELEKLTISQEKKTTQEQLQRCQQIRELVRKLPQVKNKDQEKITQQIIDDIEHLKTLDNRKFLSWK